MTSLKLVIHFIITASWLKRADRAYQLPKQPGLPYSFIDRILFILKKTCFLTTPLYSRKEELKIFHPYNLFQAFVEFMSWLVPKSESRGPKFGKMWRGVRKVRTKRLVYFTLEPQTNCHWALSSVMQITLILKFEAQIRQIRRVVYLTVKILYSEISYYS